MSGLDYAHGTGHGVGFFLNVHEGPQSISKLNNVKILEGMIVSNEPGFYKEKSFGIRIENLVYVKKIKNIFFLVFRQLLEQDQMGQLFIIEQKKKAVD